MNRIIIEVSGGVVQGVYSDNKIEVHLVDWDNIKQTPHTELPKSPDDFSFLVESGKGIIDKEFTRVMRDIRATV